MKKILFLVPAISLLISGCVVVPDVPSAHVVITNGQAGHCPPGQAKKGRC